MRAVGCVGREPTGVKRRRGADTVFEMTGSVQGKASAHAVATDTDRLAANVLLTGEVREKGFRVPHDARRRHRWNDILLPCGAHRRIAEERGRIRHLAWRA